MGRHALIALAVIMMVACGGEKLNTSEPPIPQDDPPVGTIPDQPQPEPPPPPPEPIPEPTPDPVPPPPEPEPVCVDVPKYISWENPTHYTDNTVIDEVDRANLCTEIVYTHDNVVWNHLVTVCGGATSVYEPITICPYIPNWYRARSILYDIPSDWSESYYYFILP